MVDSADILLKAAEDVQSGMWCRGAMFRNEDEIGGQTFLPGFDLDLEQALKMRRCAIGSIAVATEALGGSDAEYRVACHRAANWLPETDAPFDVPGLAGNPEAQLAHFNDYELDANDPFEAGQTLAEIFRSAATSL